MTVPVPIPTDPAADAAVHIRNLAEGLDAKIGASTLVYGSFTADAVSDGTGHVTGTPVAGIGQITGAIFGPMFIYRAGTDSNWQPLMSWVNTYNNQVKLRCVNAPTSTVNAGKYQSACGIAWGPRPAADALPRANPGDTFPAGTTPLAKLRYPGTSGPQWQTADAIHNLADDIDHGIGGAGPGLTVAGMFNSALTLDGAAMASINVRDRISVIRGAVIQYWGPSTANKSRIFAWWPPNPGGGATTADPWMLRFKAYKNVPFAAAPNNYPTPAANETLGVMAIMWGDPP